MRKIPFLILLFCFSCNMQNNSEKAVPNTKTHSMEPKLVGVWNSDENDETTKNTLGKVTMTFTNDGQLIYDIYDGDKIQKMNLTYRISGDTIISDQPSYPQEQRTKFKFEADDELVLDFNGQRTKFNRQSN
jgi:hypothetical protein